ncbi:MAG: NAD(P)/FAD-dependent oxidoreductase [Rhodospirillales bacterium]|nr:NAD(P)/FAD-dependent oxidoreductase [Rhodospirillales bacterium]
MGQSVLILGGGIGGIVAATRLRQLLPPEHRIILVERESSHVFSPSLLWLVVGERRSRQISRSLSGLARKGVTAVSGTIESIDPVARVVRVGGRDLAADHLIVALGAELAPEIVPGLAEAGHNFYTLEGAKRLRDARLALAQGRIVVLVGALPFKCPAAPYEAAFLFEADCRRRGLANRVRIDVYTPEPGPMPVAGPEVSAQLRAMVEARGIGYYPGHAAARVDGVNRRIVFANGAETGYDLLAYVPPHRAPAVVRASALAGETGWIPVDGQTLQTRFPGVYAIGDVAGIMLKMGKPLPKAGVFAHGEAEIVAHNVAAEILSRAERRSFDGHGECFIEVGDGRACYGSGNFYAEPAPKIRLRHPSHVLHYGKVAFEKYWLFKWF